MVTPQKSYIDSLEIRLSNPSLSRKPILCSSYAVTPAQAGVHDMQRVGTFLAFADYGSPLSRGRRFWWE